MPRRSTSADDRAGPERDQTDARPARAAPLPWFQHLDDVAVSPPHRLTSRTVDEFLAWASAVPHTGVDQVREHLKRVKVSGSLNESLHRELLREPIADIGRHLMLLATIGELRHPDAAGPLEIFIWRGASEGPEEQRSGCQAPVGVLEARAVEMLAYLRTAHADAMVLRAIREQPWVPVVTTQAARAMGNARLSNQFVNNPPWQIGDPRPW